MSHPMPQGVCNICGLLRPLSFEHTPPRSAFNASKVLYTSADAYWNQGPGQDLPPRGKQFQRGYGRNSICEGCNHKTAAWYVPYFSRWCLEGMKLYDRAKGSPAVLQLSTLSPLPVIKQIATMFLARHGDYFSPDKKETLVRFVLNREQRYLDPKYRFWVYLVAPGPLRDVPPCVTLNVEGGLKSTHGAEFSFPPYGYMMTLNSQPQDSRLREITHFARYGHLDIACLSLELEVLPTHGPSLGDYRSFKQISPKAGEPNVVLKHLGS